MLEFCRAGIELRDGLSRESRRRVFEIRSGRGRVGGVVEHIAPAGMKRVAPVEMKADPSKRGANGAGTIGGRLEACRRQPRVDSDGGRCVHDRTLPGKGPRSRRGWLPNVELNALATRIGLHKTHTRVGFNADFRRDLPERGKARESPFVVIVWPT